MTSEECERHARAAMELSRLLVNFSDETGAEDWCDSDEYLLLDVIIRDSAFKIERAAALWLLHSGTTRERV